VIKKKSPSRVLKLALSPEGCNKQQQQAADTITRGFSLTEIAANTDPKIAEQNRQIVAQRKKWEEKKIKPTINHGKARELKEQRLVEEAKTADDPKLTEDKRQAEELVSFASSQR
jgi:hypothetical protein